MCDKINQAMARDTIKKATTVRVVLWTHRRFCFRLLPTHISITINSRCSCVQFDVPPPEHAGELSVRTPVPLFRSPSQTIIALFLIFFLAGLPPIEGKRGCKKFSRIFSPPHRIIACNRIFPRCFFLFCSLIIPKAAAFHRNFFLQGTVVFNFTSQPQELWDRGEYMASCQWSVPARSSHVVAP